jgi:hypothetical protein
MSIRNGSTPNSPNPAKFLREMETLVPLLKAKGIIPLNRAEAREQGDKGTKDAALKASIEHQRRMDIIGQRLDEYIKELAPLTFRIVAATGWGWLIRWMGYKYEIRGTSEEVDGCPNIQCTRVYVFRSLLPWRDGKLLKAERLVWEEPKKPKSKIIRL